MASSFDYDAPSVPDTAVADVVADISSHGKLPPLSDEEREQRRIENELYRWQCQQREEERAQLLRELARDAEKQKALSELARDAEKDTAKPHSYKEAA
jgi:hypothetical protein